MDRLLGFLEKIIGALSSFNFTSDLLDILLVTFVIYGGIMNPASVIMWQNKITWEMIISAYAAGMPLDLIHAFSTAFFLWFISEPMIDKLERVKVKYGLTDFSQKRCIINSKN